MENLCYFVNSRGLLKSCDFHSNNPKSSCNNDYNYLFHMLNNRFDNMSIYVCSDLLPIFINFFLPKINKKFVLVSGDSDLTVPREAITMTQTNFLLNHPYLLKWFVQNTRIQDHPKMVQLPIGLDFHTISNNPSSNWRTSDEGYLPVEQETILMNISKNMKPFYERIPKIYAKFSTSNDRFKEREYSLSNTPSELVVRDLSFTPRTETWNNMANYTFVLSPFGNGMDCHRTWEALCLGCIPIVRAGCFKKLFEGLPVLIVERWSDINEELLKETIDKFQKQYQTFDYNRLRMDYWVSKIRAG